MSAAVMNKERNRAPVEVLGKPTNMPDRPCWRCNSRGWCGHDGRKEEWAS